MGGRVGTGEAGTVVEGVLQLTTRSKARIANSERRMANDEWRSEIGDLLICRFADLPICRFAICDLLLFIVHWPFRMAA